MDAPNVFLRAMVHTASESSAEALLRQLGWRRPAISRRHQQGITKLRLPDLMTKAARKLTSYSLPLHNPIVQTRNGSPSQLYRTYEVLFVNKTPSNASL